MTILAAKIAQAAAPPARTLLGSKLEAGRRGEEVELPVLGRAWIELTSHDADNSIEAATINTMRELGLEMNVATVLSFEHERGVRTLAIAVRDPNDRSVAFGTLEQWRTLDGDLLKACSFVYDDVRTRLDPIGVDGVGMSETDLVAALDAIEKKNWMALLRFGVVRLSRLLCTMDVRRSTSQTPPSSSGPLSPG